MRSGRFAALCRNKKEKKMVVMKLLLKNKNIYISSSELHEWTILPDMEVCNPVYHSVLTLFLWGWKRLGLKNPGGGQA